jgi:hypothetical protein
MDIPPDHQDREGKRIDFLGTVITFGLAALFLLLLIGTWAAIVWGLARLLQWI